LEKNFHPEEEYEDEHQGEVYGEEEVSFTEVFPCVGDELLFRHWLGYIHLAKVKTTPSSKTARLVLDDGRTSIVVRRNTPNGVFSSLTGSKSSEEGVAFYPTPELMMEYKKQLLATICIRESNTLIDALTNRYAQIPEETLMLIKDLLDEAKGALSERI
jgi:hypothetical protein